MTIAAIREKLHEYIDTAEDKKLEAIYTMVETEITDLCEDESFSVEMERRFAELENGTDKGVTWEEIKKQTSNRSK